MWKRSTNLRSPSFEEAQNHPNYPVALGNQQSYKCPKQTFRNEVIFRCKNLKSRFPPRLSTRLNKNISYPGAAAFSIFSPKQMAASQGIKSTGCGEKRFRVFDKNISPLTFLLYWQHWSSHLNLLLFYLKSETEFHQTKKFLRICSLSLTMETARRWRTSMVVIAKCATTRSGSVQGSPTFIYGSCTKGASLSPGCKC